MRVAIGVLILLNLVLRAGVAAAATNDYRQPNGFYNCCREASAVAYCCWRCCWFVHNCFLDSDCRDAQ